MTLDMSPSGYVGSLPRGKRGDERPFAGSHVDLGRRSCLEADARDERNSRKAMVTHLTVVDRTLVGYGSANRGDDYAEAIPVARWTAALPGPGQTGRRLRQAEHERQSCGG